MVDQQLAPDMAGLEAEMGMEVGMGMAGLEVGMGMVGLDKVGLAGEPDTVAVQGKVTAAWDKATAA